VPFTYRKAQQSLPCELPPDGRPAFLPGHLRIPGHCALLTLLAAWRPVTGGRCTHGSCEAGNQASRGRQRARRGVHSARVQGSHAPLCGACCPPASPGKPLRNLLGGSGGRAFACPPWSATARQSAYNSSCSPSNVAAPSCCRALHSSVALASGAPEAGQPVKQASSQSCT
jgi:hypothetical protein